MRSGILVTAAAATALAGMAQAKAPEPAPSPQVQRLLACRAVTDTAERLACFDREAGAIGAAIANRDIVVVDRAEVVKSRRSLFGFPLPSLAIFGGGAQDDQEDIKEVDGTVAGAVLRGDDNWIFKLQDGSVWTQTDSRPLAVRPKRGDKVHIKRGALGSYILSSAGTTGIRVRRTE